MNQQEYNQQLAKGNVQMVQPQASTPQPAPDDPSLDVLQYMAILATLRMPRQALTSAPTFTPKTFLDQIQFYDDGTNRRVYFYVNSVWRYTSLT